MSFRLPISSSTWAFINDYHIVFVSHSRCKMHELFQNMNLICYNFLTTADQHLYPLTRHRELCSQDDCCNAASSNHNSGVYCRFNVYRREEQSLKQALRQPWV